MIDTLLVEKIALGILAILFLVSFVAGISKREDAYAVPVGAMVMACVVVIAALAVIAHYTHMSWVVVYYWRYSYLGPMPVLIPLAYTLALSAWKESLIGFVAVFVIALAFFWLLGWLINSLFILSGIVVSIAYCTDRGKNKIAT